jgi:hypothetical protein
MDHCIPKFEFLFQHYWSKQAQITDQAINTKLQTTTINYSKTFETNRLES